MTEFQRRERREQTAEEREFIDHCRDLIGYWAGEGASNVPAEMPCRERLDGVVFSLLVALDGGASVGPYALMPITESEDEADDAPGTLGDDIAGCLHEYLHEQAS